MSEWLLAHEPSVRLVFFLTVLVVLLGLERRWPRRAGPMHRTLRWTPNFAMAVLGAAVVRVGVPLGVTGVALWAQPREIGLLHAVAAPAWLEGLLAFLCLDALIYWQHRLFHRWPLFWRLHRMHHSDVEFDATTGIRFHPVEILVSVVIKIAAVLALGAPPLAVIAFEIALNATSMFNHSNLRLPLALDRALRRVIVTPDMHRVHHSTHRREHDSNYGFNLAWWDHLFRSYTDQPAEGHEAMRIGLVAFRDPGEQRVLPLLLQPGRSVAAGRGS